MLRLLPTLFLGKHRASHARCRTPENEQSALPKPSLSGDWDQGLRSTESLAFRVQEGEAHGEPHSPAPLRRVGLLTEIDFKRYRGKDPTARKIPPGAASRLERNGGAEPWQTDGFSAEDLRNFGGDTDKHRETTRQATRSAGSDLQYIEKKVVILETGIEKKSRMEN
jgi:hypothetical protein